MAWLAWTAIENLLQAIPQNFRSSDLLDKDWYAVTYEGNSKPDPWLFCIYGDNTTIP
jgi:hypothetical protein